jgi:actin-related protein
MCNAGFAGDEAPRLVFSSMVVHLNALVNAIAGEQSTDTDIGNEACPKEMHRVSHEFASL